MGILGSEYQWAHLEWCRPRIPLSQLKRKGGRGVVGRPLPTKRGITSGMGYTRAATGFQVINNPCLYQGHRHLLGIPGHQRLPAVKWSSTIPRLYQVINIPLFIPGHWQFLVYTRSLAIPYLYQVEVSYSHQWPWCGECFFGLNTPEERFLGCLCVWRLGERDSRLWDDSGQRVSSNCPGFGMSTTIGGRSARHRAAASGRAASMASHVSG